MVPAVGIIQLVVLTAFLLLLQEQQKVVLATSTTMVGFQPRFLADNMFKRLSVHKLSSSLTCAARCIVSNVPVCMAYIFEQGQCQCGLAYQLDSSSSSRGNESIRIMVHAGCPEPGAASAAAAAAGKYSLD